MIHSAFNKSAVAQMYYRVKGINLDLQPAVKKFHQDNNIDKTTLSLVIANIFAEQKKLLK